MDCGEREEERNSTETQKHRKKGNFTATCVTAVDRKDHLSRVRIIVVLSPRG